MLRLSTLKRAARRFTFRGSLPEWTVFTRGAGTFATVMRDLSYPQMNLDDFFGEEKVSRSLFDVLAREIEQFGKASIRVSKSQVAFRRRKNVAVVWMPRMYLENQGAPLVLTLSFERRDDSPRWKEVTQVSAGRFTHHLELHRLKDIDSQVKG